MLTSIGGLYWLALAYLICYIDSSKSMQGNYVGSSAKINVVFIVFDDLRPTIGEYDDSLAKTPNLDSFIRKSFYFTRAYSQQALCAPSRNSFLTSRRPDTLHLYDFYSYWRTFVGNFTTLPQYFKDNGYETYSVGKIFHPGVSSNGTDDYPLSWSALPFHPPTEKFMNSPVCPDFDCVLRKKLICPVDLQTQPFKTLPDIESVEEGIRFMESRNAYSKPYFFSLGFHKPHINFRFPQQYIEEFNLNDFFNYTEDIYKSEHVPNVAWNPYTDVRARDDFKHKNIPFPYGPISEEQRAQIRQAYYASVAYVDNLFGAFMSHVKLNETIVLVMSDHGWSLGEHAEWAKYSNFEVALRVPLIIRSPEFPLSKAKRIESLTELIDVFPTVVDLAHLPPIKKCLEPPGVENRLKACTEGKSLYPQLKGIDHGKGYVALSQYPRPGLQPTKSPNSDKPKLRNIKIMGYSIRTQNFRYTLWVRFFPQNFTKDWSEVYGEEMYDHRFHSKEEINLIAWPEFNKIRFNLRRRLINAVDMTSAKIKNDLRSRN